MGRRLPPGGGGDGSGGTGGSGSGLAQGEMWESQREWALAVNAYMGVAGPDAAHDVGACEKAWLGAARVAMSHDKARWVSVVTEAAARLAENRRGNAAGDLYVNLGAPDRATDAFIRAKVWSKARAAASSGPPALADAVRAAERKAAVEAGDADAMERAGATDAALKAFASAGQWEKCFSAAAKAGSKALGAYLLPYLDNLLAGDAPTRTADALRLLATHGAPPEPNALAIYAALVTGILAPDGGGAGRPDRATLTSLRTVLYKLVSALRHAGDVAVSCVSQRRTKK